MIGIIKRSGTIGEPPHFMREGQAVVIVRESLEIGTHKKLYAVKDITDSWEWVMSEDQLEVLRI